MIGLIQVLVLMLIGLLIYMAIGPDASRMARRRRQSLRAQYGKFLTRSVVVPVVIFLALAILMRDLLLTPFLLALGAGIGYMRVKQVIAEMNTITPRQVSQLVLAFRSAYQIQPAVFSSLDEASEKVGDPLQEMVKVTVEAFFTTSSSERAFEVFRSRTENASMHQFIYILEMSESATNESVTEALDALVGRLRGQEELQRQAETGMASITGQTNFMLVLAILIAFVVALVPGFRKVYTQSLFWRTGYIILVGIVMLAAYYIDKRTLNLRAQIL